MTASSYASDAKITEALAVLGADLIGQTEQTLLQQLVVAAALGGGGGGAATWGGITGTLSAQTDLQAALDAKADLAGANTFTDHNVFAASVSLRNGTTPQTLEVYNTYTDGSNYERGVFEFDSNVLRIGTEKAGTGSARAIDFVVGGTVAMGLTSSGFNVATGGSGQSSIYNDTTANNPQLRLGYNDSFHWKIGRENAFTGDFIWQRNNGDERLRLTDAGDLVPHQFLRLKGYTFATLPASPTQGDTAFITDALAPAFLVAVVGGGTVVTPVFYNGTDWVAQ